MKGSKEKKKMKSNKNIKQGNIFNEPAIVLLELHINDN
jgi:hypothetical protein